MEDGSNRVKLKIGGWRFEEGDWSLWVAGYRVEGRG